MKKILVLLQNASVSYTVVWFHFQKNLFYKAFLGRAWYLMVLAPFGHADSENAVYQAEICILHLKNDEK